MSRGVPPNFIIQEQFSQWRAVVHTGPGPLTRRRQGQKHFCEDVLHSIFLQPFSSWLRGNGPGQPSCFSNLWSNLVSRNLIQLGGEHPHILTRRLLPRCRTTGENAEAAFLDPNVDSDIFLVTGFMKASLEVMSSSVHPPYLFKI